MLKIAKKFTPKPVKNILRALISSLIIPLQKKILIRRMRIKHQQLLQGIKVKKKIKVVYLELFKGMWKLDPVFKKMLEDPYFDPVILVCPCISYGNDAMWGGMNETFSFFEKKNYPVISAYDKAVDKWITLSDINPDIVFFSIPHNMTRKEYYKDAYLNYLSCYVPYNHDVGVFGGIVNQHNQLFHNAQWKIFTPHQCSYEIYKKFSESKGLNVEVTGYPPMERFFDKKDTGLISSWKNSDHRIRVIWAPHHTIDGDLLPFSNFLSYADNIQLLAKKYKNDIFWSFKPHPELKIKLYSHPLWGKLKTDLYYKFWENSDFSQLDTGDYIDLFLESDAMMHDCGSFLAEYMYVLKPVLYMLNENNNEGYYNDFGKAALSACRISKNINDIENFILNLINYEKFNILKEHVKFYENELLPYFNSKSPSSKILDIIKINLMDL